MAVANWARRAERKSEHRQRLIAAAKDVFGEKGYFGASVDEVAARAGLTKGAVYSSFASKEHLLLAVAQDLSVNLDDLPDASLPLRDQARHLGRAVAQLAGSKEVQAVAPRELELSILSLTSDLVRDALLAASGRQLETIAGYVIQTAERQDVALPLPPEEVATILMAVRMGLMQLGFHNPQAVPASYFEDAFELITTGSVTTGTRSPETDARRSTSRRTPTR